MQYSIGIFQVSHNFLTNKWAVFTLCKTLGVGITEFGFILSFTSWVPHFGKVHSLGFYPTLNFTKKTFLYHENIFKYVFKCAITGSSFTLVNLKHPNLDIYKILCWLVKFSKWFGLACTPLGGWNLKPYDESQAWQNNKMGRFYPLRLMATMNKLYFNELF
jgi:hypothetical protein